MEIRNIVNICKKHLYTAALKRIGTDSVRHLEISAGIVFDEVCHQDQSRISADFFLQWGESPRRPQLISSPMASTR